MTVLSSSSPRSPIPGEISLLPNNAARTVYNLAGLLVLRVSGGEQREERALREQEECIIALSGSFDVLLDDGTAQKNVHLNRVYYGLYIPRSF